MLTKKEKQIQCALGLMGKCMDCGKVFNKDKLNGDLGNCNSCIQKQVDELWIKLKNLHDTGVA